MRRGLRGVLWAAALALLVAGATPLGAAPLGQEPKVEITSPRAGDSVRGMVEIQGSASVPGFQFYKIEFGAGAVPAEWSVINETHGAPVEDGRLETWDTAAVSDGSYSLLLTVVDATGNYQQATVSDVVVANAQPAATATPAASPTPTGSPTPTPTPPVAVIAPTATSVVVDQPEIEEPGEAEPTPDLRPAVPTSASEDPFARIARGLGVDMCGQAFCIGGGIIGVIAVLIAGGGAIRWVAHAIGRRGKKEQ